MLSEKKVVSENWLCALLVLLLALSGCSSTPRDDSDSASQDTDGLPDWVLEEPRDARYAYGVGSAPLYGDQASARRVASDRARSALIAGMRVTIEGETRSSVERVSENGRSDVSRGFAEQVRASIPETTLDELEIAEVEADEENNTLYVLARLDRVSARQRLSQEIDRLRGEIQPYREKNLQGKDRVTRVRELRPAAELISRADDKQQTLALVSERALQNQSVSAEYADVLDSLWKALDEMRIDLDERDMPATLAAGLRAGLTDQGLRVGGSDRPDLILSGDVSLRTVEREPDFFAYAEGRLSLGDAEQRTLAQFNQNKRASSTDPDRAQDRVIQDLAESLSLTIGEQLFNAL